MEGNKLHRTDEVQITRQQNKCVPQLLSLHLKIALMMFCFIILDISVSFGLSVCRTSLCPCKPFSLNQTLIHSTHSNFQTETTLSFAAEWHGPWVTSYSI